MSTLQACYAVAAPILAGYGYWRLIAGPILRPIQHKGENK